MTEQVLLVNLPFPFSRYGLFNLVREYDEHLGIESLASVLRTNGIEVKCLDAHIAGLGIDDLLKKIISGNYKLVGFSLFGRSSHILGEFCSKIKELRKDICLACGGHFVTGAYETVLKNHPALDCVVRGEGEYTLLELAEKIIRGDDWHQVPGIAYRSADNSIAVNHRPLIDNLDEIPFADRVFLDRKKATKEKIGTIYMYSSRGCYGTCNFCSIKVFYEAKGASWRARSAINVVDELELLQKKYRPKLFMFVDDNFIGIGRRGKQRAKEIAEEIIRRDLHIKFMLSCRVDDVAPELFAILIEAGLAEVFLGVENFSDSELKFFNKFVKYEANCRAINYLKSKEVRITPGFIMFTPFTHLEDIEKNIKFLKKFCFLDSAVKFNFLGRVIGSSFDRTDMPGIFKEDYDAIKYSFKHSPAFYFRDPKTAMLYRMMEEDCWVLKSYSVQERYSRINRFCEASGKDGLECYFYAMFAENIKNKSFEEDIYYIKNITSAIQCGEVIDRDIVIEKIRNEWREKNKKSRKLLRTLEKNFIQGIKCLRKITMDKNVCRLQSGDKYKYINFKKNTYVVVNTEGDLRIQKLCSGDYISSDELMQKIQLNQADTSQFIEYLLEREIIECADKEISTKQYSRKNFVLCWNLAGSEDTVFKKEKTIKKLIGEGFTELIIECRTVTLEIISFLKEIKGVFHNVSIMTGLDQYKENFEGLEYFDKFVFLVTEDEMQSNRVKIISAYEELDRKMAEAPIFAARKSEGVSFSTLQELRMPFDIKIIVDTELNAEEGNKIKEVVYNVSDFTFVYGDMVNAIGRINGLYRKKISVNGDVNLFYYETI